MGPLTVLSLFSGCGGLDLGARLSGGFRTICYVEREPYRQAILMSNMREGILDYAPIHDDVRIFDARGARGLVDVVAGGDPCQPHSVAGKRKGLADERWLWPHFRRIVEECQPRFVLRENVPGTLSTGGLIAVLEDLEEMGYRAAPYKISVAEIGGWHLRKRIFVVAHIVRPERRPQPEGRHEQDRPDTGRGKTTGGLAVCDSSRTFPDDPILRLLSWRPECEAWGGKREDRKCDSDHADFNEARKLQSQGAEQNQRRRISNRDKENADAEQAGLTNGKGRGENAPLARWRMPGIDGWWDVEPGVERVVHGCPYRIHRIAALGDIVVPQQSVPVWEKIKEIALT